MNIPTEHFTETTKVDTNVDGSMRHDLGSRSHFSGYRVSRDTGSSILEIDNTNEWTKDLSARKS